MKANQQPYSHRLLLLPCLGLLVFFMSCAKPDTKRAVTHPALAEIDSLLWSQPDSAFMELRRFAESPDVDSLEVFDEHYLQLLLSELLYKNDYAQTNREELLKTVEYFDSVALANHDATLSFLDARCHYINGVGYYEADSVVPACQEYLKAVELMEERFNEKELVGRKAQFMALAYTRLLSLFSDCYLQEQAIAYGKASLDYYERHCSKPSDTAWVLNELGALYEMMNNLDSADYYYKKALTTLNDTCGMGYRDVLTRLALLSYEKDGNAQSSLCQLQSLLSKSENEKEYLSRALCIGNIFYSEGMPDSAWYYLNEVYQKTNNTYYKKHTAAWLAEICMTQGRDSEASTYTDFLVSFSDLSEQHSLQKSRLTKLSNDHNTKKQAHLYRNKRDQFQRVIMQVFVCGLLLFVSGIIIIHFRNRHKINQLHNNLETKLERERYAHTIQQKALAGRLKRSNSIIRKHQNEKTTTAVFQTENPQEKQLNFLEEEICRNILSLCNVKNKVVKSTVSYKEYDDIALNDLQKAQLIKAAELHYGSQIENIRIQFPALNEKDMLYCYLCLLGLNNTQISALLHQSKSTVWDREKRIKTIFGSKESVSVYFNRLVLDKG